MTDLTTLNFFSQKSCVNIKTACIAKNRIKKTMEFVINNIIEVVENERELKNMLINDTIQYENTTISNRILYNKNRLFVAVLLIVSKFL